MMLPIRTYQLGVIIKKDELMGVSIGKHLAQQVLGVNTDTATVLPEVSEHDPDAHNRTLSQPLLALWPNTPWFIAPFPRCLFFRYKCT
jgi:hypothetical protein